MKDSQRKDNDLRALYSILLCLVFCLDAYSQDWDAIKADFSVVWGEGWGRSIEEADAQALASLSSRIYVAVTSDYRQVEEQVRSSAGNEYCIMQSSSMSASSSVTLMNTNKVVLSSGRRSHVGRWISRSDLDGIFSDRIDRILEYERDARRAERDGRIADALRCHYWAWCLLRSLPRPSEVKSPDGRRLVNSITEDLNGILKDISVRDRSRRGDAITLAFSFRGKTVSGLDFSYFDGARWVKGRSVRSGESIIDMAPGALAETVQLRIEYEYAGMASSDTELREVMKTMKSAPLKGSFVSFRRISR